MIRCKWLVAWSLMCGVLATLAGCGGGVGGNVNKPVASGGKITMDGQAMEGLTITFVPEGSGQSATAMSGSDGSFRLTTRNTGDGAVPGNYKVIVKKAASMGGGSDMTPGSGDYLKKMQEMGKAKGGPPKLGPGEVHPNYQDPNKTPLRFEIPSGGNTSIEINLTKSGT